MDDGWKHGLDNIMLWYHGFLKISRRHIAQVIFEDSTKKRVVKMIWNIKKGEDECDCRDFTSVSLVKFGRFWKKIESSLTSKPNV